MRILLCLLVLALFSCKNQDEKRELVAEDETLETAKAIKNPSGLHSQTPNLFVNDSGVWMSWQQTQDSTDYLKLAAYKNGAWKSTTTVTSGNDWFVNWADFPAIAVNDGNILTNILKKSDNGTYNYDVKLNLKQTIMRPSMSDSISWKRNFLLHNDGTKSEHGFVSLQPYGLKSFYAVWLDGRNTAGMDHDTHMGHGGAMTLRGAIVTEAGTISKEEELDNRVCDCCQTDLVVTKNKEIIVAYRDRSEDEIRDIKIKKWSDATGWTSPITVGNDNWKIAGCPVNGPALASFADSYAVAWFTEANEKPKVQLSFGKMDSEILDTPITINSNTTIGRIDLVMISGTEAIITWIEEVGDDTLIQLLKVNKNGAKGEVVTVSKTNAERASGFPKMVVNDNHIFMAYTLAEKGLPSIIKTRTVALDAL